jgi:integrase
VPGPGFLRRHESSLLLVGAAEPELHSWLTAAGYETRATALRPGNLRYRVLIPAAHRAGVPWARFHTLRHTCAAMLIDAGAGPLRLQRWMGHHSAAFTLDTYGHLLGDDLGPHLDLDLEMR